jgi:hypothetical protein
MNDNPLIYLASPYTHPDPAVQQLRFEHVCQIAGALMRKGHLIFSPIAHTHPIAMRSDLPKGWDFWQRYDQKLLDCCDEVWVLCVEGWKESVGVQAEIAVADALHKQVRYVRVDADTGSLIDVVPCEGE